MNNNPYQQYKQTSINTASPEELVLMLYEGGIKFTNKAIIAINDKNIETANDMILRTQEIVKQLIFGLDKKRGGQIAIDYERLYDYMLSRLVYANVKKDLAVLEEMLNMFREFRDTWSQAIKIARSKQNQQQNAYA